MPGATHGSHGSNAAQPPSGGSGGAGNPHNVTVQECAQMKEKGPISAEEYAGLSADQKACYQQNPDGTYSITPEVEAAIEKDKDML